MNQCECGAAMVKDLIHSKWCPQYQGQPVAPKASEKVFETLSDIAQHTELAIKVRKGSEVARELPGEVVPLPEGGPEGLYGTRDAAGKFVPKSCEHLWISRLHVGMVPYCQKCGIPQIQGWVSGYDPNLTIITATSTNMDGNIVIYADDTHPEISTSNYRL